MSYKEKYTNEEFSELEQKISRKYNNFLEDYINKAYNLSTPKRNIDSDYLDLVKKILDEGNEKETRNGGTKSIFGYQIKHKMSDGFPLLTTKKLNFKNIWTELVWFLAGNTNISYLLSNDNYIWVGDCYKNYLKAFNLDTFGILEDYTQEQFVNKLKSDEKFCEQWGDLGPIYGKQWRNWDNNTDQIQNLIDELRKNPNSRRLMVNAWNVGELNKMVLPPCHFSWQCYSHEKDGKRYLSLAWNQRSVDVGLGLPYNIASYAMLLIMIADEVGMIPDELIGNLGDTHIYNNHIEGLSEQLKREPFELPRLNVRDGIYSNCAGDFILENYQSHPHIKLPLSN